MNEIVSSVIAFAIGGIAYIALIVYSQNKRKRRTTAEIIEEMWAKMNKQDKGGKEMSKDYRCKDCEYWKEYGMICTKLYVHAGDLAKKCKHFKLKKIMSNIKKIKAKIENSIKAFEFNGGIYDSYEAGELDAYKEILDFINSLPEEIPPEDLEVAVENYIAPIENDEGLEYIIFNGRDIKDAFKAGAEWQKQRDAELIEIAYNDGITIGKTKQKEQMMKDAVDYKIVNNLAAYPVIYYEVNHLGLKYGDKVRIIIVKED